MSIELAIAWARRTLRAPGAVDDAVRLFRQSSRDGKRATLLVSDQLTRDAKAWLARWTGHEVVVLGLSSRQATSLGLTAGGMCTHADARPDDLLIRPITGWTLSDVAVDDPKECRADKQLIGTCRLRSDRSSAEPIVGCALRVEYFRPDLARQVTGYWHTNHPILPGSHELRFSVPPLVSGKSPKAVVGTVVLFLQIVSAEDWKTAAGLRSIGNTTAQLVEMQV